MDPILIYGATGYTGRLCAAHARERGLAPILAGRDAGAVRALADELWLAWRAFPLDEPGRVRAGLEGVAAVLHAAGPFSATARPMVAACLRAGVHYVDITGEIAVFEALAALDAQARAAGVALLPGAGFDVVPSDCLAAHVAARLPGAVRLRLTVGGFTGISRGTARTMIESVGEGTRVRRAGRLATLARPPRGLADLGAGPRPTVGMSWGDVVSAWHTTGIPDIAVFFQATPAMARAVALPGPIRGLLASRPGQRLLRAAIARALPPGPSAAQRARGRARFLAEAWDATGGYAASRLSTAEAYALTARTAVESVRRAAAGDLAPGYRTPGTAFGPDFILDFPGSERVDL